MEPELKNLQIMETSIITKDIKRTYQLGVNVSTCTESVKFFRCNGIDREVSEILRTAFNENLADRYEIEKIRKSKSVKKIHCFILSFFDRLKSVYPEGYFG